MLNMTIIVNTGINATILVVSDIFYEIFVNYCFTTQLGKWENTTHPRQLGISDKKKPIKMPRDVFFLI